MFTSGSAQRKLGPGLRRGDGWWQIKIEVDAVGDLASRHGLPICDLVGKQRSARPVKNAGIAIELHQGHERQCRSIAVRGTCCSRSEPVAVAKGRTPGRPKSDPQTNPLCVHVRWRSHRVHAKRP
jgi:hypothetical protein